jgi:hypothetical protein
MGIRQLLSILRRHDRITEAQHTEVMQFLGVAPAVQQMAFA